MLRDNSVGKNVDDLSGVTGHANHRKAFADSPDKERRMGNLITKVKDARGGTLYVDISIKKDEFEGLKFTRVMIVDKTEDKTELHKLRETNKKLLILQNEEERKTTLVEKRGAITNIVLLVPAGLIVILLAVAAWKLKESNLFGVIVAISNLVSYFLGSITQPILLKYFGVDVVDFMSKKQKKDEQ